jgi:hypothetical protein
MSAPLQRRISGERRQPCQRLEIALKLLAAFFPGGSRSRKEPEQRARATILCRKHGEMLEIVGDDVEA